MMWKSINITDKIKYLKQLMVNSKRKTFDDEDMYIVDALITGSLNDAEDDDFGFDIKSHHMEFMKKLWDKSIEAQKDNSVIMNIMRGKS